MLKATGLAINLSPSRLEAAVVSGRRVVRSVAAPLDPDEWGSHWTDGLTPLDATLAGLLRRLEVRRGVRTTVFHESPDAVSELFNVPAGGDAAVRAARLRLAEALRYPAATNPVACAVLARDSGGEHPDAHVLAVADRDDRAQVLFGWVVRAGCRPVALIPMEASLIATAVSAVLSDGVTDGDAIVHFGEHRTVITAASGGSLQCLRSFDLGCDLLIQALIRSLRPHDKAGPPTAGERDRARTLLFTRGIPEPDDIIDASANVRGASVLPLLQPIIQRYVVETRQTVRFGMNRTDPSRVRLVLVGPGAAIPRLGALLSEHLETEVTGPQPAEPYDPASCGTELRNAVAQPVPGINLLPRAAEARRAAGAMAVGLRAGAAVAGLLLAADAARIASDRAGVDRRLLANEPVIAEIEAQAEIGARADDLAARLADAEASLAATLGEHPDWVAILRELSALGNSDVRLVELAGEVGRDGPVMTVRGVARVGSSDGPEPLSRYLESLSASPLTRSVQLTSTRNSDFNGAPARSFVLRAQLHGLPHPIVLAEEPRS